MKNVRWDLAKSEMLKRRRGVSFEEIMQTKLVGAVEHPGRRNQRLLLFEKNGYIWVVPYVGRGDEIFLKTLFPSRQYTKKWRGGELP